MSRRWIQAALIVTLLLGVSSCTTPASSASALQIIVGPHPDDELQAMTAVDHTKHQVWVVATRGEAVARCDPAWPAPRPDAAPLAQWPLPETDHQLGPRCAEARINSWLGFLRDYSRLHGGDGFGAAGDDLPTLDRIELADIPGRDRPTNTNLSNEPGTSAWVRQGKDASLVVFDGGDGDLRMGEVQYIVDWVLAQRGGALPDLPLDQVVGASYYNNPEGDDSLDAGCLPELCSGHPSWATYRHPDHLAVNLALARTDFGAERGNLVPTWKREDVPVQELALNEEEYCALMCLPGTPGGPGLMQSWYAWLAFPGDYWPPTDVAVDDPSGEPLIMARTQQFIHYGHGR